MENDQRAEEVKRAAHESAWRDLITQYAQEADAGERERLVAQWVASRTPDEQEADRDRLRTWVLSEVPPEVVGTDDYRYYEEMLPSLLAGRLDPTSTPYARLLTYLDSCDPCYEEYQELRAALDEERAARRATYLAATIAPALDFPNYNLDFLGQAARAANERAMAAATWQSPFRGRIAAQVEAGLARLRMVLEALAPPPTAQVATMGGTPVVGEWKPLLSETVGPAPDHGLPNAYTLLIRAERTGETMCRLHVTVGGPGFQHQRGGVGVRVEQPDGMQQAATTDPRGTAQITVPIAQLPGLVVIVIWASP